MKTHVVVLYGGRSTEHEVSCRSAAFILKNLDANRFHRHAIGIGKDGNWWPQETSALVSNLPLTIPINTTCVPAYTSVVGCNPFAAVLAAMCGISGPNATQIMREQLVVFPVLHGTYGEDGTMQGMLELSDIAFVGPDSLGSSIGMDKVVSKKLVESAGVPVVPWVDFRAAKWKREKKVIMKDCLERLSFPMFVKPARLGSSVGVSKVKQLEDLEGAVDDALRYDDKILVERGLDVREIECAVLGGYDPRISIAGEVITHSEFYSYKAKYLDAKGASVAVPADLSLAQLEEVQNLTRTIFEALELYGMARIDLFLDKHDNKLYFNEVNTIPGFTQISQYPMLWNASGVSGPRLIEMLVDAALVRHRAKRELIRNI